MAFRPAKGQTVVVRKGQGLGPNMITDGSRWIVEDIIRKPDYKNPLLRISDPVTGEEDPLCYCATRFAPVSQ